MNDADLDDPINDAFSQVKENTRSTKHGGSRNGSTVGPLRPLSRSTTTDVQSPAFANTHVSRTNFSSQQPTWWFASAGFPLITGTFGPIANAFSICALVETWRIEVPPGGTASQGRAIPDPSWLIAVNAVSLALALIANMSLLLNMARKISFSVAQPVTIIGFWVSSVILIVLIVVASLELHEFGREDQVLTQAYYFACWAAGIYQVISYMMCITVYGALKKKYDREFRLTTAQRSLMLQTIMFLCYMLIGALAYTKIEGWKYTDSVYWATFTLLTIGIGDFAPATHLGRSLLFPFAIGGIVALGLIVSSIRSLVIDRGKKNVAARLTDNMRRRLLAEVENIRDEHKRKKRMTILNADLKQKIADGPSDDADDELDRREAEFRAMRRVQHLSGRRQKWVNLLSSTMAFATLWFIGALVFSYTERGQQSWSYFESLYFSYTSLLTIGYGDIYPVSDAGKAFFVFWALLAVPSLTILISDMGDTVIKFAKDITIYIGELTILPSDEGNMLERLQYGVHKITRGSHSTDTMSDRKDQKDEFRDTSNQRKVWADTEQGRDEVATSHNSDDLKHLQENTNGEQNDGTRTQPPRPNPDSDATRQATTTPSDTTTEEDHHKTRHEFHHLLLTQIRRVHADSILTTPKKYAYHEWAFFLEILGENERDSSFHRIPFAKEPNGHDGAKGQKSTRNGGRQTTKRVNTTRRGHNDDNDNNVRKIDARISSQVGDEHEHDDEHDDENNDQNERERKGEGAGKDERKSESSPVRKWSWLGPQSPLLSDKTEAALLLDLLFQRLEESLRQK